MSSETSPKKEKRVEIVVPVEEDIAEYEEEEYVDDEAAELEQTMAAKRRVNKLERMLGRRDSLRYLEPILVSENANDAITHANMLQYSDHMKKLTGVRPALDKTSRENLIRTGKVQAGEDVLEDDFESDEDVPLDEDAVAVTTEEPPKAQGDDEKAEKQSEDVPVPEEKDAVEAPRPQRALRREFTDRKSFRRAKSVPVAEEPGDVLPPAMEVDNSRKLDKLAQITGRRGSVVEIQNLLTPMDADEAQSNANTLYRMEKMKMKFGERLASGQNARKEEPVDDAEKEDLFREKSAPEEVPVLDYDYYEGSYAKMDDFQTNMDLIEDGNIIENAEKKDENVRVTQTVSKLERLTGRRGSLEEIRPYLVAQTSGEAVENARKLQHAEHIKKITGARPEKNIVNRNQVDVAPTIDDAIFLDIPPPADDGNDIPPPPLTAVEPAPAPKEEEAPVENKEEELLDLDEMDEFVEHKAHISSEKKIDKIAKMTGRRKSVTDIQELLIPRDVEEAQDNANALYRMEKMKKHFGDRPDHVSPTKHAARND